MATSPIPPPQGGPQGPPQGAPQGGGNAPAGAVLQLVAIIAKASDDLKKIFPAAAPMADEIQNQTRLAMSKIGETQAPSQPPAPPI